MLKFCIKVTFTQDVITEQSWQWNCSGELGLSGVVANLRLTIVVSLRALLFLPKATRTLPGKREVGSAFYCRGDCMF